MLKSRDYINTEEIVDFGADSFLKVPIQKLLSLEGIDPIAPQIAIINAINDPRHRFVTACLSRRTGKTFVANRIAFAINLIPNTHVLIMAPDYNLARISWDEQQKLIRMYDLPVVKNNSKDRVVEFGNGSTLRIGSVNKSDSVVGRSYDLILFDEAAIDGTGKDAFNIRLRPTLDKPNSKAIFISTPRGDNYFKEFYDRGFSDKKAHQEWVSIHSTWRDNPRASEADIETARATMSKAEFAQEYEADFTTFEGQIYEGFDENNIDDLIEMDFSDESRFETIMGVDPGYKDPTAGVIIKYDLEMDKFYIIKEYLQGGVTTDKHAEVLGPWQEEFDVDLVFIDSAAAQFRQDLAVLHDIPSMPAVKSVLDGVSYVAALVDNNKVVVDKRLTHVIMMFRNYRWDPRQGLLKEKPLHDGYSHMADAIRYAIYSYTR